MNNLGFMIWLEISNRYHWAILSRKKCYWNISFKRHITSYIVLENVKSLFLNSRSGPSTGTKVICLTRINIISGCLHVTLLLQLYHSISCKKTFKHFFYIFLRWNWYLLVLPYEYTGRSLSFKNILSRVDCIVISQIISKIYVF